MKVWPEAGRALVVGMLGALALPLFPAAPAAAALQAREVQAAVSRLPGFVRQFMARSGVPGVAVAVVYRDRLVYAEGFGVRHVVQGGAITADTVFQLASVSKPLSATVVAASMDRGQVGWDTPVAPLLPGFALIDPWVSRQVTIGDLFAHRSGLPGEFGNDLEPLGWDRQQIFERARLEPLAPFRASYGYSNFGLTAGAIAVARASGRDWPSLSQERLFAPLGMTRSSYRHADFVAQPNRAALHQQRGGRWIPGPIRDADAQAPAGGASSTVLDLARWMRMVLAEGRFEGRQIVPRQPLDALLSLQVRTSTDPRGAISGYGYGIGVQHESGEGVAWSHSGAFTSGASTEVRLMPELAIGIVTLTNGWLVGVPEAINATFDDLVRQGRPSRDWLKETADAFAVYTRPTEAVDGRSAPSASAPSRPLRTYAGTYANAYVGTATVVLEGEQLVLALGPQGLTRLPLQPWDGDGFVHQQLGMPPGFLSAVRFSGNDSGRPTELSLEMIHAPQGTLRRLLP